MDTEIEQMQGMALFAWCVIHFAWKRRQRYEHGTIARGDLLCVIT